jgi:hypothetical protein
MFCENGGCAGIFFFNKKKKLRFQDFIATNQI